MHPFFLMPILWLEVCIKIERTFSKRWWFNFVFFWFSVNFVMKRSGKLKQKLVLKEFFSSADLISLKFELYTFRLWRWLESTDNCKEFNFWICHFFSHGNFCKLGVLIVIPGHFCTLTKGSLPLPDWMRTPLFGKIRCECLENVNIYVSCILDFGG